MTIDDRTGRRRLSLTTMLVRDYDEAIAFCVGKLGFELREDTKLADGKRWVVVGPPRGDASLLLASAIGEQQSATVGRQGSGRVFLFLETDDFARDHARYLAAGVVFREPLRSEPYGMVSKFEDLYENLWDLIEPHASD
ncbi:VOC family protein [Azospirillum formosense]|uniref:VOC family protein n=1 Tax=Azospirillum formosense TaxID=861533 RepID=UPI001D1DC6B6|nr:VOC family protein [Azospirillum formosense]MBY3757068.1 VOC family protein [Azospirillum formosense]